MALTQLNAASAGISRLRTKGGAKPDTLYDLLNGYVDESGAIQSRPGTVEAYALPAGTKGMCAFDGGLVVFSHTVVPGMPSGVTCEVLTNPNNPGAALRKIHYAGPFLGYLYVTAEFADGGVYDYWLQRAVPWEASHNYTPGFVVSPTTPNGLTYRATRTGERGVLWAADVERNVGDEIEPTTDNGYKYVATETYGSPARSGDTEPEWIAEAGAVVIEEADAAASNSGTSNDAQTPPDDVIDRYGLGTKAGTGAETP